jgi:NagD protein
VDESHFYTSAMATAKFLDQQAPGCSAYVIGSAGLLNALHDVGITMNDVNPDYVVVGETSAYNFMMLTKAMQLVEAGAKLIATNSDISGPGETGNIPACKALVAPLELTTGRQAYFVGKPNPLIMRTGLKLLGVHSAEAAMIGDNMNTDIIAGIETGLMSVLVLSGVSTKEGIKKYAYQPNLILNNVGEIVPKKV